MLPIISYNGTCRFPVREQAFLLMETTVPFKGTGISSEETNASEETYRNNLETTMNKGMQTNC